MRTKPHPTPLLLAKGICKSFKKPRALTILKGIDLEVKPGDSLAITGRSGEGKSTLLHILGTLERSSNGELWIGGEKVTFWNASRLRRQKIAFVFQSYHLLDDYSVIENILMPCYINRKDISKKSMTYQKAKELLDLVGLKERASFPTKLLSGGEKQRVALIRAFVEEPDLLLADEPSGNLDQETAESIHRLLVDYTKKPGKALIIVTHHEKLASLCSRRLELKQGFLSELTLHNPF
jgi:lipoprotein-releasing system ATP-binding protein